ncbi:hypothetical protein [Candidatus Spongiihabitans sp.]|uniref:hypothetical protein n=1 Tax=Candidatus Spongiihabitans sp. TaxID=3101308 RepID=UPI003C7DB7C3
MSHATRDITNSPAKPDNTKKPGHARLFFSVTLGFSKEIIFTITPPNSSLPGLFRAIQLNICHAQRDSFSSVTLSSQKNSSPSDSPLPPPTRHCPACSGQSS